MNNFTFKSVETLQNYLNERGVTFSSTRKQCLIELCELAREIDIEVDRDDLAC